MTCLLYSGRPDPRWYLTGAQLRSLYRFFEVLPAVDNPPPGGRALGYRGCLVQCTRAQDWFAYCGAVMYTRGTHPPQYRHDPDRRFERWVLHTAPAALLPADLISL